MSAAERRFWPEDFEGIGGLTLHQAGPHRFELRDAEDGRVREVFDRRDAAEAYARGWNDRHQLAEEEEDARDEELRGRGWEHDTLAP